MELDSEFTDTNSTFENNLALNGGAIFGDRSVLDLDETKFVNNYAYSGGAIQVQSFSTIRRLNKCNFTGSYASNNGGALLIQGSTPFTITDSIFYKNYALDSSCLFCLDENTDNTITGTTFQKNHAGSRNAISLMFSTLLITNANFIDNSAESGAAGVFVSFSEATIQDTTFDNSGYHDLRDIETAASQYSNTGGSIMLSVSSTLTLTDNTFYHSYASVGGAVYVSGSSSIKSNNNIFEGCYATIQGGALSLENYENVSIENCNFTQNSAGTQGNDIYSSTGSLSVYSSNFNVAPSFSSVYLEYTSFEGTHLMFKGTGSDNQIARNEFGGGIYALNMESFKLSSSNFESLTHSQKGGAIALEMTSTYKQTISSTEVVHEITNVNFISNQALQGGAMHVNGMKSLEISQTKFIYNLAIYNDVYADSGRGAALKFTGSDPNTKLSLLSEVEFKHNIAESSGGSIYWDYIEPEGINDPEYINNTATQYGNNIACFPQRLIQITSGQYADNSRLLLDDSVHGLDSISIADQGSGHLLPEIYLAYVDQYDQIVGHDSSSSTTLNINITDAPDIYTPVLSGTTSLTAANGKFAFIDISFTGEPNMTYNLYFETTGIDPNKQSNQKYLTDLGKNQPTMDFEINLRSCLIGEQFLLTGECQFCSGPYLYSLEQVTEISSCKSCPTEKATCLGGSNIGPNPGFWRSSNQTDNFIECQYHFACLGFVEPDWEPTGKCATGYQGILCGDCEVGFSRTKDFQCSRCPDQTMNIIRISLIMVVVLICLIIIIKSTLDGALIKKNLQSIYIKILMNHLQLIVLTASFDFDWPDNVTEFYDTTRPVSQVAQQILSFD